MYTFESRVRFSELDSSARLSLDGMINYFQDCTNFQSETLGVGMEALSKRNRVWFLSAWQIEVLRYPAMGEAITIGTFPYEMKGIYGYRNFFMKDDSGSYLAMANSIWFFMDTRTMRPVKPGEEDIKPYQLSEKLPMNYCSRKVAVPETLTALEPITVYRHHLDTNHHMNNSQYISIALDALPEQFHVKEMQIEYKQAAKQGDVIFPSVGTLEGGYGVTLMDDKGKIFASVRFAE